MVLVGSPSEVLVGWYLYASLMPVMARATAMSTAMTGSRGRRGKCGGDRMYHYQPQGAVYHSSRCGVTIGKERATSLLKESHHTVLETH